MGVILIKIMLVCLDLILILGIASLIVVIAYFVSKMRKGE